MKSGRGIERKWPIAIGLMLLGLMRLGWLCTATTADEIHDHAAATPMRTVSVFGDFGTVDSICESPIPLAAGLFRQGLAMLHGGLPLPAKASFIAATLEDPQLAIAYWGIAHCVLDQHSSAEHDSNWDRFAGRTEAALWLEKAQKCDPQLVPLLHRRWIQSLDRWLAAEPTDPAATSQYLQTLNEIREANPQTVEDDLMVIRETLRLTSPSATDREKLSQRLQRLLHDRPSHPGWRYVVVLANDNESKSKELANQIQSIAPENPELHRCIAESHWMAGRVVEALRHASLGVAAHRRLIQRFAGFGYRWHPDQIRSHAALHRLIVEASLQLGDIDIAVATAERMIRVALHAEVNHFETPNGSFVLGRESLIDALIAGHRWQALRDELSGPLLTPTEQDSLQAQWRCALAVADHHLHDWHRRDRLLRSVRKKLAATDDPQLRSVISERLQWTERHLAVDSPVLDSSTVDPSAVAPSARSVSTDLDSSPRSMSVPDWGAFSSDGAVVFGQQWSGRDRVLVLHLGQDCLHCAEQLQAFAASKNRFETLGVELIGIGLDPPDDLRTTLRQYGQPFPFELVTDPDGDAHARLGCVDPQTGERLHGTFFIDKDDRIRFFDIGDRPLMDPECVLSEIVRQRGLDSIGPRGPSRHTASPPIVDRADGG